MSLRNYLAGRCGKPNYTIFIPDPVRSNVEAASGGKNTVMYDDLGQPSIMVRVDPFNCEDIDAAFGAGRHPAFAVGKEYWVGKYPASILNNRAVSLPSRDPAHTINFDTAMTRCRSKGAGWDLLPNGLWAAIALRCWKDGTIPTGNNTYSRETTSPIQQGIQQDWTAPGSNNGNDRTLNGSGPLAWSHDGTPWGIRDLNGNVWEWVSGMRLNAGEIQIVADPLGADHAAGSAAWRAILQDGSLVAPGTADTLKYDNNNVINITTAGGGSYNNALESFVAAGGVTVPDILKQLALAPGVSDLGGDRLYYNNTTERLPYRGGGWYSTSNAGVFACNLAGTRSSTGTSLGFRPAFVSEI